MTRSPADRRPAAVTVSIEPRLVAAIAAHAARHVPGVTRLGGGVASMIAELTARARGRLTGRAAVSTAGVQVSIDGDIVHVRVDVAVDTSRPAARIGYAIQRDVTDTVTTATGLTVSGVAVSILAVDLPGGQE